MKRILTIVLMFLALCLPATVSATASNGWRVNISDPADQTSKTFKVQYTAFSTTASDKITVELFQNNASVGTQTTLKPYGDSGAFDISVPSNGTYSYYIKATNSSDETPKTTNTVTIAVHDPAVTTITPATATRNVSADEGTDVAANGSAGGSTQNTNSNGTVGEDSASDKKSDDSKDSKDSDDKKVLSDASSKSSNLPWYIGGLALVIAAIASGYYWIQRRDSAE
jgi:hypothetical protein